MPEFLHHKEMHAAVDELGLGLPLRRAALAAPTQFPILPLGIDNRFPVSFWVNPCSTTIFTASAFSSALYLRCSFILFLFAQLPHATVSTKLSIGHGS